MDNGRDRADSMDNEWLNDNYATVGPVWTACRERQQHGYAISGYEKAHSQQKCTKPVQRHAQTQPKHFLFGYSLVDKEGGVVMEV